MGELQENSPVLASQIRSCSHGKYELPDMAKKKVIDLTAWDKLCIPLHLRASGFNNSRTSYPNWMKFEMGYLIMVSTLIPKFQKIIAIEWRSAPDIFKPFLLYAARSDYKIS